MLLHKALRPTTSSAARSAQYINRQSSRTIMSILRNALGMDPPASPDDPTVENRFHPWDSSPSADLRHRAATIRALAKCPVTGKEINYTCPISGIPTHHSEEAWEADTEYHETKRYEILKKVNVYEHDLRSGRPFPEFDFPASQEFESQVNLSNWDLYFYTRQFYSMDTEFQLAAVTKMLSYPITVGALLHQFSPYLLSPKGPITLEGLKSLAALRYSLYPFQRASTFKDRPLRMFIVGSRAEGQLPGHVWKQLTYLFPDIEFELHFIGPEAYYDRERGQYISSSRPIVKRVDPSLSFVYHTDYFHVFHEAQDFFPYDPYLDCFFLFHPGLAYPDVKDMWKKTMPGLLESKCPVFITGYHEQDSLNDWNWVMENFGDDLDVLMNRQDNLFSSTKWELNDVNPHEVYKFNQKIFAVRGKRYHAIHQ
ncbi:Protein MSS51, mitochondrial [Cyberlindnera fabianii]|uniref:Protein MSS51, mitochondrial n=1 Tax=Cyberlindnera fabianii TaxID=36022 RepID=A0A1V2L035_CYBFA|nr:Protein MSS51, mitochondrial [Cyberlindnera fabianii]